MQNTNLDVSEIYRWYDVFKNGNQLVEIRIIGDNMTFSGYFTSAEKLVKAILPYEKFNIYFTVNAIDPSCYGRAQHDVIVKKPKNTTSDAEIIGRDWVFIDLDAVKIAGINATDEQVEFTKQKANEVYKFLINQGFNPPVVVFSGNGVHLYLKCALKINEENNNIVKRFIQALGMLFSDENVDIDAKVFNPARIAKVAGTYSRKGTGDDPIRKQRLCKIIKVPSEIKNNDIEYFKKIANLYPEEVKPTRQNNYSTETFDLEAFIAKHNIAISGTKQVADGTRYYLDHCPFNEQHKKPDAILFQHNNGAIAFTCFHNSCANHDWRAFRELYEPDAYEKKQHIPHRTFSPLPPQKRELVLQDKSEDKGAVWQSLSEIEDEDRSKIVSIPSGIAQYDKECCGFDKPSLSVWSGNNGSAKSTLLNQIALNAVNRGFKVALYSGELRAKKLKRWLLFQAAGKQYNTKSKYNDYDFYTPNDVKQKITEWLDGRLYNYNTRYSHDIEQVCLEVRNLVKSHEVDMLIMDNLSSLDIENLDGGINEQQKAAIKMLVRLTEELEISTHLVIHPKKGDGGYLRKNDVSGAKTLTDLADSVFFVHRWNQDTQKAAKEFLSDRVFSDLMQSGTTNIVEVIKHREFGEAEGHIYKLYFESESRRLKNDISEHIHYGWEDSQSQTSLFEENREAYLNFLEQEGQKDTPF